MEEPGAVELRRATLAVSVLADLDLVPGADGITLPGSPDVEVSWDECRLAVRGADPEQAAGRARLTTWLLGRRYAADAGDGLRARLRPLGLPVGHVLHPGPGWPLTRVLGGSLELGLGGTGLDPRDPDAVVVLPPTVLPTGALEIVWPALLQRLEELGRLAAERTALDPRGTLRPCGEADAVTLLAARSLRTALAGKAGGLAAVVVPMRARGWTGVTRIDPAFGPAAAAATAPAERGFVRPLLVTEDEVVIVPAGGRPQIALQDPGAAGGWARDVVYR